MKQVRTPWTSENFKRLRHSIETLDHEIKGRCALTDADLRHLKAAGPDGTGNKQERSYELLRQSLAESQKRCASYNDNMLRVAQANDELSQTLNTVKSTNKRLVDQLQAQQEEVNQLIQLRLRDEEILDAMKGEFEKEQDGWRVDVGTRLDELSSLQDEKYDNMKSHYTQKLHAAVGKIKQFSMKKCCVLVKNNFERGCPIFG